MFFLIRVAFWLCVVLVLLPSGGTKQSSRSEIRALDAVSAASATVADMSQFCSRQPEACAVGSQAAMTFGQRAQAGAKMVYEFINERMGPQETGSVVTTGAAGNPPHTAKPSQNTLRPADLSPAWRGPPPPKDAHSRRSA